MSDFWTKNRLIHTLCERTAKALMRLRGCAGSPEPSLVAYVINTKISWAGSLDTTFTCCRSIRMKYSRRISLFCSQSFLNHYNMFCTSIFPFSVIDYTTKHISAIKLWCDSNLITAYAIILGFIKKSVYFKRSATVQNTGGWFWNWLLHRFGLTSFAKNRMTKHLQQLVTGAQRHDVVLDNFILSVLLKDKLTFILSYYEQNLTLVVISYELDYTCRRLVS